jgi:hypothetical protein
VLCCPCAESLDYFQQGDSSADEGAPGTEEAVSGSAMDTSSPRTTTNFVRRTSSNPESTSVEPSASSHISSRRRASRSRDHEPDHPVSSGGAMAPSTAAATNSAASASPSANTLDANSDAGEKLIVPCCQLCAVYILSLRLKKCFMDVALANSFGRCGVFVRVLLTLRSSRMIQGCVVGF